MVEYLEIRLRQYVAKMIRARHCRKILQHIDFGPGGNLVENRLVGDDREVPGLIVHRAGRPDCRADELVQHPRRKPVLACSHERRGVRGSPAKHSLSEFVPNCQSDHRINYCTHAQRADKRIVEVGVAGVGDDKCERQERSQRSEDSFLLKPERISRRRMMDRVINAVCSFLRLLWFERDSIHDAQPNTPPNSENACIRPG